MSPFPWKPLSDCASLVLPKKTRHPSSVPTPESQLREAMEEASEDGSLSKSRAMDRAETGTGSGRLDAHREFLRAAAAAPEPPVNDLPLALSQFLTIYPKYKSSEEIDTLRVSEYSHLSEKACLDYCGFGLFSYLQGVQAGGEVFSLSEITANLCNHAMYGGGEPGTAEHDVKARIMDYLSIPESEYGLVFTVSRGSAFKLLAESYPFQASRRLVTMFDHESQSVSWMVQRAKEKGAKVAAAGFRWPTLKPCAAELRKVIAEGKRRRRRGNAAGLFVFPVQSRVSGAKYSYQWMAMAQQHGWHVLLDAGALGPKDMDSLGLSLFRPDFIVTSFYRVFGADPTGFGCLLIRRAAMNSLVPQGAARAGAGIVRIVPVFPQYLSDDSAAEDQVPPPTPPPEAPAPQQLPAFSGAFTSAQVQDVFETEAEQDGASLEELEDVASIGDVMKSPVFIDDNDDDDDEYSFWIDLGSSPQSSGDRSGGLSWFASRRKTQKDKRSPVPPPPSAGGQGELSFDAAVLSVSQEPEIQEEGAGRPKESAIRRETEGEFRLLDRRELNGEGTSAAGEEDGGEEWDRREPEIVCRHLDHIDLLGLNKTTSRLRYLVNWLVISLLQLRLPGTGKDGEGTSRGRGMVMIYGPKIKYERGPAVAFNVREEDGAVIPAGLVQRLAERVGISLSVGYLSHIRQQDDEKKKKKNKKEKEEEKTSASKRREVVTASLGFLTNFEDVYKLWSFVAEFRDPNFVRNASCEIAEEVAASAEAKVVLRA